MKKLLAIALCAALTICVTPDIDISAASATTLSVNCGSTLRTATHCASGSLYGITETLPSDIANLVAPLNPDVFNNPARAGSGYQQSVGAAIPVASRLSGTTGKVSIRLADIFPSWPYAFTTMSDWLSKVSSVIDDKLASGYDNYYGYEIWNEPDGTWDTDNGTFNNMWQQTYNLIRSKDPDAKIIGPSLSYYSHSTVSSFLSFCKSNSCLPDIISWHELSGIQAVAGHFTDYRALETSLGVSARPISINEYCDATHANEGCPASLGEFFGKFERYKIDSACISWWFTAHPGRLGSLLASNTAKGGGWWFMNWYGQMRGNMVSTAPADEKTTNLDGCASVNSSGETVTVLCGGGNTGTVSVTLTNLPSFIGSTASVKVEAAPWTSKDTTVANTTVVSQSDYTVSNSQITVTFSANQTSGYRILVTPGSASGIQSGHIYKLENQNSARVLGITNMSTSAGGTATQWEDNGTADHEWLFTKLSDGYYTIKNVNSGLLLGVTDMSTSNGARIVQWSDNGTSDHEWSLVQVSGRTYKLVNKNSGKVIGVSDMSCASGASVVQWSDSGTVDHNWYLEFVS